jgi:4-hydroxy-2-oxoheptanedioate aldolase
MRQNPLREAFAAGTPAIGCWLSGPSSITAEIAANVGYDFVCIDLQHGLIDYSTMLPMLQAISLANTTAAVRVPWNEPGIIGKVLDAGAMTVIVPMVNTAEEAEQAIVRGMYAPRGARSSGPTRAQPLEGPDYAEVANDHVLIVPMVETAEAVENIDGILSTDGVDAIYVGPMDLGVSMGLGRGTTDPAFIEALDHIVERCNAHGVVPGIHCTPETITDRIERGYRMTVATTELSAMRVSLVDALSIGRGAVVEDTGAGGGY